MFILNNIFVDDKHLPKVLTAMAGLVISMDVPRPVINAVVKNGKVAQASSTASFKGRLIEYLGTIKGTTITTTELKAKFAELGANPNSLNGALTSQLLDEKVLKRKSKGVFFTL